MSSHERVELVDALRGFALCGVFVSNSFLWFGGRNLLPPAQLQALGSPLPELVTGALFLFFVAHKFLNLFGFLFGLGFALQLSRAEARGSSHVPVHLRRMGVLLCFGAVHLLALWMGDILHLYALTGVLLLLFAGRPDRALWRWVVVLLGVMPPLVFALQLWGPGPAAHAHESALRAELLAALSSDSVWTAQAGNARYVLTTWFSSPRVPIWITLILGRFLLGLLAGRHRLFQDVERHRPLLRRMLWWGLGVGGLLNAGGLLAFQLRAQGLEPASNAGLFLLMALQELGYVVLGAAYLAGFALLFQRERWRRALAVLSPVGRMALTNYLMQTVVSLCLYNGWGLGLISRVAPSHSVVIALGLFAGQVLLSHAWLKHFRFGPAEWLWRSLTYGRLQ
ncbi:DUF418 domain-containing protein [Corallococcus aberystwythensis]|uniref:DUF418 domain-containing protein n=1 Tax=Corallococcus aberystwythensis TaxID=2316722 RepID=A0A3A8PX93_9BACT|nr:DUF418 domain-containing protein [Corallococcus aberystwythensis]RKH59561.1 DUF418 domain-containing protein [Corallococcus aberystwythensis]